MVFKRLWCKWKSCAQPDPILAIIVFGGFFFIVGSLFYSAYRVQQTQEAALEHLSQYNLECKLPSGNKIEYNWEHTLGEYVLFRTECRKKMGYVVKSPK